MKKILLNLSVVLMLGSNLPALAETIHSEDIKSKTLPAPQCPDFSAFEGQYVINEEQCSRFYIYIGESIAVKRPYLAAQESFYITSGSASGGICSLNFETNGKVEVLNLINGKYSLAEGKTEVVYTTVSPMKISAKEKNTLPGIFFSESYSTKWSLEVLKNGDISYRLEGIPDGPDTCTFTRIGNIIPTKYL